jgi:biofilm protein TabA
MIIDKIKNLDRYVDLVKGLDKVVECLTEEGKIDREKLEASDVVSMYNQGTSRPKDEPAFEAHRKNADLMLILSGQEEMEFLAEEDMVETVPYDEEKDIRFFKGRGWPVRALIPEDYFYIVFPGEGHKPCVHYRDSYSFEKYVVKLPQ